MPPHTVTSEEVAELSAIAAAATAEEQPPPWAQAMQRQLAHLEGGILSLSTGFAELRQDVNNMKFDVTNIKLDMAGLKKSIRLAYCRPGLLSGLVCDPDACAALLGCCRSDLSGTCLMSKSEITADFVVNDRGAGLVGDEGGDCQLAAEAALKFFEHRKIMKARREMGVMYSPSGAGITMGVASGAFADGRQPDARGEVRRGSLAYTLVEGCLWTRDPAADVPVEAAAADPLQPRVGCMHFVVSVDTLDGERVVVDWGIKQFEKIPVDMRLFI
jgi:hypothetical protein